MPNQPNAWIKQAFTKLRAEFGNVCSECGATENLEFSHLKPTGLSEWGRGRKERYYDIINHRDSYKLRCRGCNRTLGMDQFEG